MASAAIRAGFIIDLARRAGRRIMVRLVKGAYWGPGNQAARRSMASRTSRCSPARSTDVSATHRLCRKLLAATDAVFPQFSRPQRQTLATIYQMAGSDYCVGKYGRFQCLHGMGETALRRGG